MFLLLSLLLVACSLGLLLHLLKSRRWSHLPGAHWLLSMPVVGHAYLGVLAGATDPREQVERMRRKYGDVFRFDIGHDPTVILCDYDDIVASSRTEALLGKPYDNLFPFIDVRGKDPDGELAGVFFCKGRTWRDLRKFTMRELSDLGMGKKDTMEAIILQEAEACMEALKEDCHKPIAMHHRFSVAINNVIWRLVTGRRTCQRDPEMNYLTQTINDMFDGFDPSHPLALLQMNYRLVYSAMKALGIKTLPDYAVPMKKMVTREIASSEPDPDGSFIERFLAQIQSCEGDPAAVFHGKKGRVQLLGTAMDLFVAGTDTTTTQLEWCVMYLVKYPEVQERMRGEIDAATGGRMARPVSLQDREETPYVMSAIEEMLRFTPELFVNVPHFTHRESEFKGYRFPLGTQILHWHHGVHFSPKYFDFPHEFRGHRFLDEEGRFTGQNEHVLTFSTGKRRCVGEKLARAELYIFLCSLVQAFEVSLPDGRRPSLEWGRMVLPHPKPFDVVLKPRSTNKTLML